MQPQNSSCNGKNMSCDAPRYFSTTTLQPVDESSVPSQLQTAKFPANSVHGPYDGITSQASGGCETTPGPANSTLFCVNTLTPAWVAFRWYKYINQPAFQHLSLSTQQKQYLQNRIENFHRAYPPGTKAQWIKPGVAPSYGISAIDPALIVTPPQGLEIGYVPIVVYEGYSRPSNCVVPS